MRRALVGLGLALLAACNKGSSTPSMRLSQPSAVAVFSSFTSRHATLWPYAAVANSGQDELIVFDAVDNKVVAAPIVIRPLSIPVGAPRPALLATAQFTRPLGAEPRPSLLVAVAAGSSELQLVRTWRAAGATGPGLADEAPIDLGSEILAVVAAPAVEASADPAATLAVADRVRVVAALAGGQIAVVEYQWTGDPGSGSAASVGPGTVTTLDVGFDGLSLAVDPRDPAYVYAATVDPIPPGIHGVAEIDMRPPPASWIARAIDAHAPTRLVAAFSLRERALSALGAYDQYTQPAADQVASAFQETRVRRVYAWRDPGACGPKTAVECGIAVLDPVAGDVLEDPWRQGDSPKRYLSPITLPSRPVAMIVGPPPLNPPASDNATLPGAAPGLPPEFMRIDPLSPRLTTGVLLLPSEDGRNYFADLARWETPSSVHDLAQDSGTGVFSFRPSPASLPRIGFYRPSYLPMASWPAWDPTTNAASFLQLTPGFTPTDQWTVTFQGYLPDFATSRAVQVESAGSDQYRVSFQAVPPGSTTPTQVVNVYDPAYGVRVGDVLEFWTDGSAASDTPACPDTTPNSQTSSALPPVEGKVIAIERPSTAHPGGALVVQRGDCVPIAQGGVNASTVCDDQRHGPWNDPEHAACWGQLPGARFARIRGGSGTPGAEEFVVVGARTGYAGRAVSSPPDPQDDDGPPFPTFSFTSLNEATLVAQCGGLIPYPSDPLAVPDCDAACRTVCEQASIARRARRLHNTSVSCYQSSSSDDSYCKRFFPAFAPKVPSERYPPPEDAALAFSLGWRQAAAGQEKLLVRDTRVTFQTRSGRVPAARWAGGGDDGPATLPTGGAYFDRTENPSWDKADERYRFFVPYVGNLVLDLSPARENGNARVLR